MNRLLGIQIGKLLGADVTAIAGSSLGDYLNSYGADQVYDYNEVSISDVDNRFDIILDLTNMQTLDAMRKLLTPTGIFIPAEPNMENGGETEDSQVAYLMVMHGDFDKLTQISGWVSDGSLKPVVDREFQFSDYLKAFSRLKEKGRRGRIIMSW